MDVPVHETAILRTYARLWADDLDATLPLLERLVGRTADLRFAFDGVELAAIGDFLVVAGDRRNRDRYAHASATVVVADLDRAGIAAELGDVLWYVAVLADHLDLSLDDIAAANLAKLAGRQQRGVLGGSGDHR